MDNFQIICNQGCQQIMELQPISRLPEDVSNLRENSIKIDFSIKSGDLFKKPPFLSVKLWFQFNHLVIFQNLTQNLYNFNNLPGFYELANMLAMVYSGTSLKILKYSQISRVKTNESYSKPSILTSFKFFWAIQLQIQSIGRPIHPTFNPSLIITFIRSIRH